MMIIPNETNSAPNQNPESVPAAPETSSPRQTDFFNGNGKHGRGHENGNGNGHHGANGHTPKRRHHDNGGLKAPSPVGKNFVLDTNVLLHDPECIHQFADNHVCIPLEVLNELDRFKNEQSERGANARSAHRMLAELFSANPKAATVGVPTREGGTIRLIHSTPQSNRTRNVFARIEETLHDTKSADHRILIAACLVEDANTAPVVLITKDLNLFLKGLALGLKCEDYQNDKVSLSAARHELIRVEVQPNELQRFASSGSLTVSSRLPELWLNDYVILSAGDKRTIPARYAGGGAFERIRLPDPIHVQRGPCIRPLNLGQQCFLDALMNPDISLVTCYGQAGTGKTLLAVASALHSVMQGDYDGVTVSRPVVPLGDTLGFLPGTLEEKLDPWLKPIFDALEFILHSPENKGDRTKRAKKNNQSPVPAAGQGPGQKSYQPLIESGMIEVEALCYIRGRSIPNRFFILDEAQQLTPLEAKTIVTRMAKGSKLVMTGDPAQIDNPYVDSRSNGLVYAREKLKGHSFTAHVTLERGERSPLAEAGARLM